MELYEEVVQDLDGNAIEGAQVRVLKPDGSVAEVFNTAGVSVSNPVLTGPLGEFAFQAANGKYMLRILVGGVVYRTVGPVLLYDPADDTEIGGDTGGLKVGIKKRFTAAVRRTAQDVAEDAADVSDFFIAGEADSTAAMQRAVNSWQLGEIHAVTVSRAITVNGTVYLSNVETSAPERQLKIYGPGSITKTNAGNIFDRAAGLGQQAGNVLFSGVTFRGAGLTNAYVLQGDNIIRVHFTACFFHNILCAKATDYLQSIYFTANTIRKWAGWFIEADHLYDVAGSLNIIEHGDSFLRTTGAAGDPACNSMRFTSNVIEGLGGKAFSVGACFGSTISDNYMEINAGGYIDCGQGTGFHKGLTIRGNSIQPSAAQNADSSFWPINLGKGAQDGINVGGNASTGRLYTATAGNQSAIVSVGDYAPLGLFSSAVTRRIYARGYEWVVELTPGYGVSLNGYTGAFQFEGTRSTVNGENVPMSILAGGSNPQTSPGDYGNPNWQKGTYVHNTNPSIALRQYGTGVTRNALIKGWLCLTAGQPGVWQEDAQMLPYS